jgi:hypothetical protein
MTSTIYAQVNQPPSNLNWRRSKLRLTAAALALTGVLLVCACATAPKASVGADAEAKRFTAPTGMARVYAVRPGVQGSAGTFQILVDGQLQGDLPIRSYLVSDVAPGKHTVMMTVRSSGAMSVVVDAAPGHVYFVHVASFGNFRLIDEAGGRREVESSSRVLNVQDGR